MKAAALVLQIFLLCLLWPQAGCEPTPESAEHHLTADNTFDESIYAHYAPAKIDINPLTEFINTDEAEQSSGINAYVSLLDCFDSQVKSPGVFRFELYERIVRSTQPKGKRVFIWPDIDLTDPAENNNHWRDFLRAYQFGLDFQPRANQDYMLQATCLCPNGKRLSAQFRLKHTE